MNLRLPLLAAVGSLLISGIAHAQLPGVDQEVIARGTVEYAPEVDGPADIYVGTIRMEPGARYGRWHIHPGQVWVVVTSGELAVYGPDGCRQVYQARMAYLAEADVLYDLRNESDAPLALAFSGIIRAGEPATVFVDELDTECAR